MCLYIQADESNSCLTDQWLTNRHMDTQTNIHWGKCNMLSCLCALEKCYKTKPECKLKI